MSTDIKIKLAKRIRELRKKNKLTQEGLSALSGIDYKHIQRLESIKNTCDIKISTLEKLAKAFQISLPKLLNFK